jgi:hypothetical protein
MGFVRVGWDPLSLSRKGEQGLPRGRDRLPALTLDIYSIVPQNEPRGLFPEHFQEKAEIPEAGKNEGRADSGIEDGQMRLGDGSMTEQPSQGDHDKNQNIAFPGENGKQAAPAFHGQNPLEVFVGHPQKAEMVDDHGAEKPHG